METAARGRLVVWDTPGPAGAPTLVLLHGVTLDAESNWGAAVPTLARSFRVLTLDLRGHGAGPPARVPYRLEDCADDVASAVRALGTGPVIVAGYSMGGMIAQAFWHRYPELTAGLVLCATARNVSGSYLEQLTAITLPFLVGAVGVFPSMFPLRADLVGGRLLGDRLDPRVRRAVLARMRRMPLVTALAAMDAVCHFSSHRWIGGVDVPCAVLVTRHDTRGAAEPPDAPGPRAPGGPGRRGRRRPRRLPRRTGRLRPRAQRRLPRRRAGGGHAARRRRARQLTAGRTRRQEPVRRRCCPPSPGRRTDRLEDLVAWALTSLGLFALLGSVLLGCAAYNAALGRDAPASPVRAVLLADAPRAPAADQRVPSLQQPAPVTWTAADGVVHVVDVRVPPARRAGSR